MNDLHHKYQVNKTYIQIITRQPRRPIEQFSSGNSGQWVCIFCYFYEHQNLYRGFPGLKPAGQSPQASEPQDRQRVRICISSGLADFAQVHTRLFKLKLP